MINAKLNGFIILFTYLAMLHSKNILEKIINRIIWNMIQPTRAYTKLQKFIFAKYQQIGMMKHRYEIWYRNNILGMPLDLNASAGKLYINILITIIILHRPNISELSIHFLPKIIKVKNSG